MEDLRRGCVAGWALVCLLLCSCAQVPRESIELADTVGRDVASIEKSHLKFVNLVYDTYERDVNDFVDNVYVPYYVRESLQKPSGKQLLDSLTTAGKPAATREQQKDAYDTAELWLQVAHERVERMRSELLAPLKAQRAEITSKLSEAYDRVQKANSAVSGYLASVAKVTDLQNDLLSKLGVPDLSDRVAQAASQISSRLDQAIPAADKKLKDVEALKDKLSEKLGKWRNEDTTAGAK